MVDISNGVHHESEQWCHFPNSLMPAPELSALKASFISAAHGRLETGAMSADKIDYLQRVDLRILQGDLRASAAQLEKLRRLCQIWDVRLRPRTISSHRKFVGPIIVTVKKLLFPIMEFLLRDAMRQQREFNATTIRLLADLCSHTPESRAKRPSIHFADD